MTREVVMPMRGRDPERSPATPDGVARRAGNALTLAWRPTLARPLTLAWPLTGAMLLAVAVPVMGQELPGAPPGPRAPFEGVLPAFVLETRFLGMLLWQWLGLGLLVLLALLASSLITRLALRALHPLRASGAPATSQFAAAITGPLRVGIALAMVAGGGLLLSLPPSAERLLVLLEKGLTIVLLTWLLLRVIDVAALLVGSALVARERPAALAILPVARATAKVVAVALAVIAVLQTAGIAVTGVLAGLGIGGLAVALAAQKTLEHLFAGIALMLDQPVRVGDFCRFGDQLGTVEEIGLRSTRVRTLERTVVSVPNADFASMRLENFARRDRIWLRVVLGLRYETTPDQLRYVLVEIRRLLYSHPRVDPAPARIRLVGFGAHALELEVFAYVPTTDFDEFLAVREDIYLRMMDIVAASGTTFAFPSQTLYLGRDRGLDPARAAEAEARVRAWREGGEMLLPDFPPATIAALGGTLDYPPEGSAARAAASR
jgi:MscS family membrane protein